MSVLIGRFDRPFFGDRPRAVGRYPKMLTFILAHLIIGALLGTWLRFGALFPAFVLVAIEAAIAANFGVAIPWFFLLLAGVLALQLGYASASFLKAYTRRAPRTAAHPSLSPQK